MSTSKDNPPQVGELVYVYSRLHHWMLPDSKDKSTVSECVVSAVRRKYFAVTSTEFSGELDFSIENGESRGDSSFDAGRWVAYRSREDRAKAFAEVDLRCRKEELAKTITAKCCGYYLEKLPMETPKEIMRLLTP